MYGARYSFLIFPWLVILCIVSSYIINLIYKPIIVLVDNRFKGKIIKNKLNKTL